MLIESRSALDPEVGALVTAQQREIREIGGGRNTALFAPGDDTAYMVAVVDGRAVACGAWRALEPGAAELTHMYVRPAFRGRGIARQMIVAIEEEALAAGRPVIRLETGTGLPAAIALFQSSGYRQIPAYGSAAGVCFGKRLAALVHPANLPAAP